MGKNNHLRHPGIEPGSIAWEATMLTTTPIAQQLAGGETHSLCRIFCVVTFFFFSRNATATQRNGNKKEQKRIAVSERVAATKKIPSTGLEPAIFGSGNQRLIH
jgi:hypothetical protein